MSVAQRVQLPYAEPATPHGRPPQGRPPLPAPVWTAFLTDARPISRIVTVGTFAFITVFYLLLWCPDWYPLSDSALYLILGRALASGYGYSNMGEAHHMAMPLTPLMLAGIIRAGGGIGAMHAAMIALMLLSHLLSFLTLRRWFKERIALMATVASACSYWVFINAFTIYTEPLFLVVFWAALLLLSYVPDAQTARSRSLLLVGALLLMVVSWFNRVAAALLFPSTLFALWMVTRHVSLRTRLVWLGVFGLIFGSLTLNYLIPPRGINLGEPLVQLPPPPKGVEAVPDSGGEEGRLGAKERYQTPKMLGVTKPLVELPMLGGRWISEVLVMPTVLFFKFQGHLYWIGWLLGATTFALFLGGWLAMFRMRQWWVVAFASYLIPFWIGWGTRVKPRYMLPITPILFLIVWTGLTIAVAWLITKARKNKNQPVDVARVARWTGGLMLGAVVVGNLPPYIGEIYIRHIRPVEFYDQARRGSFAELVDICAYVGEKAEPMERVWTNRGIGLNRRVMAFLSGRPIQIRESQVWDLDDPQQVAKFLRQVKGRFAIVYNQKWPLPEWHHPLEPASDPASLPWWKRWLETIVFGRPDPESGQMSWWRLYERDPKRNVFQEIRPPRRRDYVSPIPPAAL